MEFFNSKQSAEPVGPYSHCVKAGNTYYVCGQVPFHPVSGKVVGITIKEQAFQTLYNLKAVLDSAGLDVSNIAKTHVYLDTMDDFEGFNEVYAEFMGDHRPARLCLAAKELAHGCLLEMDAIAYKE
ncbi:2-iminobutanoate/2-iminopropanoate deaminase [Paucidesulfovibrio gracilis DSM 16080]|uniref:2-iminobutanoate/2-iminopropanoate deaminase n=1 Tax=Paucidesulfovibrio gracilis DSM 16080 TaxID=1121449 RepID=A0A1T4W2F8_9BACT|nr:Rid family detoxifying hydrolase [Paucidesulfovibrio gracilis]SKA71413.1 2-iminobutanoate/2-iminopropanoate deaminase [Paucidesulfovibrio gracilis DSM 16080]